MTTPLSASLAITNEAAIAYAKRFGLVRQDGTIQCAKPLCARDATLPSLCCEICLQRHRTMGVR